MLILIKLALIVTVIIFYQTGKRHGDNGYKWALVGFIGFLLGFFISMSVIGETFISFIIACVVVYFSRLQLLKILAKTSI